MMNTIFLFVAIVATAIFLLQFILSVFLGELDLDADVDSDLGGMLSFKGLTHFCIGMGWYMYLSEGASWLDYAIGFLIGLFFVWVLWLLYKKAYQLQKEPKPEQMEDLVGRGCIIYAQDKNGYIIQISINGALREKTACSEEGRVYCVGDKAIIKKVESGILYIQ